jgi:hypothetical protein
MKTHVIQSLKLNMMYAEANLADLSEAHMVTIPKGMKNHPAWLVGHVIGAYGYAFDALGAELETPEGWSELFGAEGASNAGPYPTKDELLTRLRGAHAKLSELIEAATDEQLAEPTDKHHPMAEIFPRVGDLVVGASLVHEATHMGQLSAWRTAMQLPIPF